MELTLVIACQRSDTLRNLTQGTSGDCLVVAASYDGEVENKWSLSHSTAKRRQ